MFFAANGSFEVHVQHYVTAILQVLKFGSFYACV